MFFFLFLSLKAFLINKLKFIEKKSPMQSRSQRDSEEGFVKKRFCSKLFSYSILYHILHFCI